MRPDDTGSVDVRHALDEGSTESTNGTAPKQISQRTLGGIGWSSVGTVASFIANLGTLIVLARILDPTAFGVLAAGYAVVTIARIGTQSVGQAVLLCSPLDDDDVRTASAVSGVVGLASAIAMIGLAATLQSWLNIPRLAAVVIALSPILVLRGIAVVPEALLQRELRFRLLSSVQAATFMGGYAAVSIVFALCGFGLWSMVLGYVVQSLAEAVLLAIRRPHPRSLWPRAYHVRRLLRSVGILSVAHAANVVATNTDNLIVGGALGPTALGLYTRAYRLVVTPANLYADAVDSVLTPAMRSIGDEDARLANGLRRAQIILVLTTLPLAATCIVLGHEIIGVMLGPKWTGAVQPFRLLCLGMFFRVGSKPGAAVLKGTGRIGLLAVVQVLYATFVISGAAIGQVWGLPGVALGVALALAATFLVVIVLACQVIKLSIVSTARDLLLGLGAALLTGLAVWGMATILYAEDAPQFVVLFVAGSIGLLGSLVVVSPAAPIFGREALWWHDLAWTSVRKSVRRGFGQPD